MTKILLIMANTNMQSLNASMAQNYISYAKKVGYEVKEINLIQEKFDPILKVHKNGHKLEKTLKKHQELIARADHIVFIYPTWWFNISGILKGWLDRVLEPGFAYKRKSPYVWDKLLTGKTASIYSTADGFRLYYILTGHEGNKSLKKTLKFCGISIKKTETFFGIKNRDKQSIQNILNKMSKYGSKGI